MDHEKIKQLIQARKKPKEVFMLELPSSVDEIQDRSVELVSDEVEEKELLTLDISRYGLQIKRNKSQFRYNKTNIILRLDIYSTHTNPEFVEEKAPMELKELMKKYSSKRFLKEAHLHFYIEGYNDKWAFPLCEFGLKEKDNFKEMVEEFCKFCNIVDLKFIYGSLFC